MSIRPDPRLSRNFTDQIKTQDDLADLSRQRLKISPEKILSAGPEEHLGYRNSEGQKILQKNSHRTHNGYSPIFQHNCPSQNFRFICILY